MSQKHDDRSSDITQSDRSLEDVFEASMAQKKAEQEANAKGQESLSDIEGYGERRLRKQSNLKGVKGPKKQNDDEDEEDEDSGFSAKFKKFASKFKLGPHHRMERFAVFFGILTTLMLVIFVGAFMSHRGAVSEFKEVTALFTEEAPFSKSNQTFTFTKAISNKDNSDVLFLFKASSPETLSIDAENYELFITTLDGKMDYEPEVNLAFFGGTGYGYVRLRTDDPMPSKRLSVIIRSYMTLDARQDTYLGEDGELDESFEAHDQAELVINPGAVGMERYEDYSIEKNENDPRKLYTALVANELDTEIHDEIATVTKQMGELITRSDEYIDRIDKQGYIAPLKPWFIDGDYVDDDGHYHAKELVNKAYDIEYIDRTIKDGYVNQIGGMKNYRLYMLEHTDNVSRETELELKALREQAEKDKENFGTDDEENEDGSDSTLVDDETGDSFEVIGGELEEEAKSATREINLDDLREEVESSDEDDAERDDSHLYVTRAQEVKEPETIVKKDGTKEIVLGMVNSDDVGVTTTEKALAGAVQTLVQTWTDHRDLKVQLQRDLMRRLLVLDADVQAQEDSFSELTDQDAIFFY